MKPTFWILLLLLIAWLLGMSYCQHTMCNCTPVGAVVPAAVPSDNDESLKFISISDADNYKATLYDNLLFAQSNCMYEAPISDSLNTFFQDLADYLVTNTDRILILTGLYQNSETNNCNAENLGYGRAESVRQLLTDQGVSAEQIRILSRKQNILDSVDDKIMGGIQYSFVSGNLEEVESRLRAESITLYFDSSEDNIYLDEAQTKYFDDLKYFLDKNSDARALVIGHTDDEGSAASNRQLSRARAENIRDFMISRGILKRQIITAGRGAEEPVSTNDTAEGRADNRRVEITIE